ncbi:ABC transporter ATP-binding protein [Aquamicrobium sp. LC103]|uniref:ABC transporter ATP-binding protein n=1 Tax=Aquamicrobium sp. LC103 TaxID=1120658 RepID=UPI00063EC82F|nr:ABC transporter ATP-binding protein [Aquamicrobium sp. LC103]TKT69286.1 ABC transporter ATP-binding protein [Aquamicrobium sp. LC103]
MSDEALLSIRDLQVSFAGRAGGRLTAVRGVNVSVDPGEVLGLVGESGSGKSATMMAVMGLLPGSARIEGSVRFRGDELVGRPERFLRGIRGKRIGMIFQDPMTSLDPLLSIGAQIAEAVRIHDRGIGARQAMERAIELLATVSIPSPRQRAAQYPHEFSGGMRQRVVIAMAIANDPDLLIADEPTTALDVTIQAQIMELLQRLCAERKMGLVLVTHDLGVVAGAAHNMAVMYAGRIVDYGPVNDILTSARHPYTRALLDSLPRVDRRVEHLDAIAGAPPSLFSIPGGCAFHPRCRIAMERCRIEQPPDRDFGIERVACHRAEQVGGYFSARQGTS